MRSRRHRTALPRGSGSCVCRYLLSANGKLAGFIPYELRPPTPSPVRETRTRGSWLLAFHPLNELPPLLQDDFKVLLEGVLRFSMESLEVHALHAFEMLVLSSVDYEQAL